MLKPLKPKFRSALSVRLKNIVEKQVPAKLKPKVVPNAVGVSESEKREDDASQQCADVFCRMRWKRLLAAASRRPETSR